MRKIIILLVVLLSNNLISDGQVSSETKVDSVAANEKGYFKLSKKEFISKFGRNDTCLAIIDLFFKKRINATIKTSLWSVPFFVGGIASEFDVKLSKGDVVIPFIGVSSTIVSTIIIIPFAISGVYQLIYFSQKRLFVILSDHEKGKPFPENIINKTKFGRNKWMSIDNDDVYK